MTINVHNYSISGQRDVFKDNGEACPIATQVPELNAKNRERAIKIAGYGTPKAGTTSLCGNCKVFNIKESMLECIDKGLPVENPMEAGDRGYCEAFHFACSAANTCNAWVEGGPMEDEEENHIEIELEIKIPIEKAKAKVGDVALYSVRKPEGTVYATGKIERIETSGKVKIAGTSESEEATPDNPIAVLRVYAETEGGLKETDRRVVKPVKELRMTDKDVTKSVESTLQTKAEEHNAEVGDAKGKRITAGKLMSVYRRGVGAYRTNPSSVRPNVTSAEQWAMARVNGFLYALKNGRYKNKPYDTDLLPDEHPLARKESK